MTKTNVLSSAAIGLALVLATYVIAGVGGVPNPQGQQPANLLSTEASTPLYDPQYQSVATPTSSVGYPAPDDKSLPVYAPEVFVPTAAPGATPMPAGVVAAPWVGPIPTLVVPEVGEPSKTRPGWRYYNAKESGWSVEFPANSFADLDSSYGGIVGISITLFDSKIMSGTTVTVTSWPIEKPSSAQELAEAIWGKDDLAMMSFGKAEPETLDGVKAFYLQLPHRGMERVVFIPFRNRVVLVYGGRQGMMGGDPMDKATLEAWWQVVNTIAFDHEQLTPAD